MPSKAGDAADVTNRRLNPGGKHWHGIDAGSVGRRNPFGAPISRGAGI